MDSYQAIIFDFDGVLLDSEPLHFQAYMQVLRPLQIDFSYDLFVSRYVGLSDVDFFPKVLKDFSLHDKDVQKLMKEKVCLYEQILLKKKNLHFAHGAKELLERISAKNKPIAICSGSTKSEIFIALDHIDNGELKKYFSHIVTVDDVQEGKPSPKGYLETARRMGIDPERCLAIEDSPKGIEAAKSANMRVTAITSNYGTDLLDQADRIVSSLVELIEK